MRLNTSSRISYESRLRRCQPLHGRGRWLVCDGYSSRRGGRLGCLFLLLDGGDECHARADEALLEELRLVLAEVSLGLRFEHLKLVYEYLRAFQIRDGLAGLGVRHLAQQHERHLRLLHHHAGEDRGHRIVLLNGRWGRSHGVGSSVLN